MAEITIFEFDLTDAQFNAPFAGASKEDDGAAASDDVTATDTGSDGGPSLLPLFVLVGLVAVAYLVRRWRTGDETDIEVTDVAVEPDSET